MAIVRNKGNSAIPIDPPYNTPNRTNAGPPASANYAGEIVYDSTAKACIVAVGGTLAAPMWGGWVYGWEAD
jgi:hypothetical protein